MLTQRQKLLLKISVSLFLLGWVFTKINWDLLLASLREIDALFYIVSTLFTLFSIIIVACKYYLLINNTAIRRPIPYLIKINLIGRYYSLFIPSAVGQAVVRWFKVTRNQEGRAFFAAATLFERLTFIFTLLLFCIGPLFYSTKSNILSFRSKILPLIIIIFIVSFLFLLYFIFPVIQVRFGLLLSRIPGLKTKSNNIRLFLHKFSLSQVRPISLFNIFILSLIFQICFLGRLFFLVKGAHIPLTFWDVAWIGSLVLFLQILPVSLAGLGVREGAYAFLFSLFGLYPEKGVLIGILFFSQMLIFAGVGVVLEYFEK